VKPEDFEVVKQYLAAAHSGDLEGAIGHLHPRSVIEEAGGTPFAGTYLGPDGFRECASKARGGQYTISFENERLDQADEFAVYQSTVKFGANGRSITMKAIETIWVEDGKVIRLDVYQKDPSLWDQLLNPPD